MKSVEVAKKIITFVQGLLAILFGLKYGWDAAILLYLYGMASIFCGVWWGVIDAVKRSEL